MEGIIFTIHDIPGLKYSPRKTTELVDELRKFASLSLNPLPNYQIFANADDKVVVTAHSKKSNGGKGELLAFTSAVMITILELPEAEREECSSNSSHALVVYVYSTRPPNSRLWVTSLAEVPNSLVHIATFFSDVFPSPSKTSPSETDLLIARAIDREHRDKMLISATAVFDERKFVFMGSCVGVGAVFVKDVSDPQFWHRDRVANDFYRELLKGEGDEVLQVAYIDGKKIAASLRALGIRAKL